MEAPEADTDAAFTALEEAPVIQDEGICFSVSGRVPAGDLEPDDRIFIRINEDRVYEAFPCCGEDGSERFFLAMYEELTDDDVFEIALSRT